MDLFWYIWQLDLYSQIWFWICFVIICGFCFINGFHDTANSVATIIYTNSLKPLTAVIWSGIWNFLGLLVGWVAVAFSIVKLVPLLDVLNIWLGQGVAFLLSFLIASIVWNLFTWRRWLPASSSHTLIGSILWSSLAFSMSYWGAWVNWSKAWEIALSLLFSPIMWFWATILVMWLIKKFFYDDQQIEKKLFWQHRHWTVPPFWIRFCLILTWTAVSFSHGSNDWQKWVWLLLLVLYIFLPNVFLFNPVYWKDYIVQNLSSLQSTLHWSSVWTKYDSQIVQIQNQLFSWATNQDNLKARQSILQLEHSLVDEQKTLSLVDKESIKNSSEFLSKSTNYTPYWIVILVSVCLGLWTTIGRKKIVYTVWEKIWKSHLTYAEWMSAQLVWAATIMIWNKFGLPVSTTHVLSSWIAGSMVAQGWANNLDKKTISQIALAWILTLPLTIWLAFLLYILLKPLF